MSTIFGKALKGLGKAIKYVSPVAALATDKKTAQYFFPVLNESVQKATPAIAGAAITGEITGITDVLSQKIGAAVNNGADIQKVIDASANTGTVLNSEIKTELANGGVKVSTQETNEIAKQIADKATPLTSGVVIRDKTSETIEDSTDKKIAELESLTKLVNAKNTTAQNEYLAAKAGVLLSSLKVIGGPKVDAIVSKAEGLISLAPEASRLAIDLFNKQGISPSLTEKIEFPTNAEASIFSAETIAEIKKNWRPVYWVYLGLGLFLFWLFKSSK